MLVGELFTALGGIGGLLLTYSNLLRMDKALGPVVVLIVLGVVFTEILKVVEKRVLTWKETERAVY